MSFNPRAGAGRAGVVTKSFRCFERRNSRPCGGAVMSASTPRIALAMGVQHYRCDKCGTTYAMRAGGGS